MELLAWAREIVPLIDKEPQALNDCLEKEN